MYRFGVVAYPSNMDEYYTQTIAGYVVREEEHKYPLVMYCRSKDEALVAARDLATLHANVKFNVFELFGGYESLPQRPTQYTVSEYGILPV